MKRTDTLSHVIASVIAEATSVMAYIRYWKVHFGGRTDDQRCVLSISSTQHPKCSESSIVDTRSRQASWRS